jgi:hypothetical protein
MPTMTDIQFDKLVSIVRLFHKFFQVGSLKGGFDPIIDRSSVLAAKSCLDAFYTTISKHEQLEERFINPNGTIIDSHAVLEEIILAVQSGNQFSRITCFPEEP